MKIIFSKLLTLVLLSINIGLYAQDRITEPEMIFVEGGSFKMGSADGDMDEQPIHKVTLSDFYISKYEITVAQYRMFCEDTDREFPAAPPKHPDPRTGEDWYYEHDAVEEWIWIDDHPIVNVSWNDAVAYCEWMSDFSGRNYRLPTEAEWEYAAGGGAKGKKHTYSGDNNIALVAWYDETTYERGTQPVGTLKANELGIHDMSGNAWEWCGDYYNFKYYAESSVINPKGPETGNFRVIRGGSWYYSERMCRITTRDGPKASTRNWNYGFRVVIGYD